MSQLATSVNRHTNIHILTDQDMYLKYMELIKQNIDAHHTHRIRPAKFIITDELFNRPHIMSLIANQLVRIGFSVQIVYMYPAVFITDWVR
jgi:hypothetical protein